MQANIMININFNSTTKYNNLQSSYFLKCFDKTIKIKSKKKHYNNLSYLIFLIHKSTKLQI